MNNNNNNDNNNSNRITNKCLKFKHSIETTIVVVVVVIDPRRAHKS